jgi:TRAP-type C4-dicarboxylate transport system substrate-binding protein
MHRRDVLLGGAAGAFALAAGKAGAQDVTTLRFHALVPKETSLNIEVIVPWGQRLEAASGGRLKFEFYPSMQLGGTPSSLFDQVKDGVVELAQAVLAYTPGRFPKAETFELPFLMTNAEQTSVAVQEFVEANAMDEFAGVKLIALSTLGPGLLHTSRPVSRLEDLKGMKIRGGSRIVNDMLARLGAEPVGLPVPQVPHALTTGVIDGTTQPWDLTQQLRLADLVRYHTSFAGGRGLYTLVLAWVMNRGVYDGLPDDLRAIVDAEPGVELARALGRASDQYDLIGRQAAEELGNNFIELDEAETARWRAAVQPTIEQWYAENAARGVDGKALHEQAMALVDKHAAA